MQNSGLMDALDQFEKAEANLLRLERIWSELQAIFPKGISFGDLPEYEDKCRSLSAILSALPKIDGEKLHISPPDLNAVAQNRLDFFELGEPLAELQYETSLWEDGKKLRQYRFDFDQKRREVVRHALFDQVSKIDDLIKEIRRLTPENTTVTDKIDSSLWSTLTENINRIEVLLGSSISLPPRWGMLRRHLHFGQVADLSDIECVDWPDAKAHFTVGVFGPNEPIAVEIDDLADLVKLKPRGHIATKLNWSTLKPDDFERLMFTLISDEAGYENPEWLMQTNAPDRGRDLSVYRVATDRLSGTTRSRIVIQCKHWLTRSIALKDASEAMHQTSLWTNPPIDILVIATSGRFTADAVQWIEMHNSKGVRPKIEMWAESNLERILAGHPALIAEFGLRDKGTALQKS